MSIQTPRGFSFAGVNAGIKAVRKDMALVFSEAPASCAGCFTVNTAKAAPVLDAASRLPASGVRAIVVNSGNANALTGPGGLEDVLLVRGAFAETLRIPFESVFAASTGVIGVRLPVKKLIAAAPKLADARTSSAETAAEAIMTTDTRMKLTSRSLKIGGVESTITAIAKGSGMIAPQLATMLAFIATDLAVTPHALQVALRRATSTSFDNLTVDNDMSTNDAVFAMANGLAGNAPIGEVGHEFELLARALTDVCVELAKAIAEDGEGATKRVDVTVSGAPNETIARDLARSIAGSNLVKAAIFGADPNWGRVLATIGARAGSQSMPIDPQRAKVSIQGVDVFDHGGPVDHDAGSLRTKMRLPIVTIDVVLAEGSVSATAWGCDLSYDYVKINADYTSLTTSLPEGQVVRDDRLTNYSPGFKRALLVEALSYISKFSGKRAVIKYGGAAMVKPSLKASFAGDVQLLRSAGLLPIIVHGGGPEITKTLQKLDPEKKTEFIDGIRVTDAADLKVVEMVLTGRINTEIVSLLNASRADARAVGVSGKDGGLLRAKKLLSEDGRDLGRVGEVTSINRELLELLLDKAYLPVISPIGLAEDGDGFNINADAAAAEIAVSLGAEKLIFLTDVPGIMEHDELISEISADGLRDKIATGVVTGGMVAKARSILRAIEGGVQRVHIVDGRTPHSLIAELFTDRGVGTLITA